MSTSELVCKPVTTDLWLDMQALFTTTPTWGCWCMWWRTRRKDFNATGAAGHKAAMQEVIESGAVPGLLAYRAGAPVGWVSVGPRTDFAALENSRVLKRIDDLPVWSIVCFLAAKKERGKGIMADLIRAAVDYAVQNGAQIVEAYPRVFEEGKTTQECDYMGILSTFERLGFTEVARPSKWRAVVRYWIQQEEKK
jgi:GNAT superfamily N-acetyltransferase